MSFHVRLERGGRAAAKSVLIFIQEHSHLYIHVLHDYLVGGFNHFFYCPFHIWDVILPIDELIFFKMVKTTNQIVSVITIGKLQIMHTLLIIYTCGFHWLIWLGLDTIAFSTCIQCFAGFPVFPRLRIRSGPALYG